MSYLLLQKQQSSLIAGLRATNETPTEIDNIEEKSKENNVVKDSEGETKEHDSQRHRYALSQVYDSNPRQLVPSFPYYH